MNCDVCERRLLSSADPDDPPADVALHLADCPGCRDRQRRLVEIEAQVPLLPVPVSYAKASFLQRILNEALPLGAPATVPLRRRAGHRLTVVLGGLAAAAAIIVGVILSGVLTRPAHTDPNQPQANRSGKNSSAQRPGEPASPQFINETLVARLVGFDLRLAQAEMPQQRLNALEEMADAVRDEAKTRTSAPEALAVLAQLYEKTVAEGIVPRARALPPKERPALLRPAAARLATTEREVEALAQKSPRAAVQHLERVANVAREGQKRLRALLEEVAP
jgi:hypothetical protein